MRIAVLVIGILGILLGLGVTIVSLLLPSLTRGVSPSEAMLGVIPGVIVFFLSLIIAIVGLVLVIKRKK
jgi:hypothetical protein